MQKNDIALRAYMVTVLRTGSDKFGQVWTSQNTCEALSFLNRESHTFQIWPTPKTYVQFSIRTSLETLRPYEVVETALRHASGVNWYEVQLFFGAAPKAICRWKALD